MFENFDWIGAMRTSPVMVVILLSSVVTFGFAIERALFFWKRRGNPDAIAQAAEREARAGNVKEAAWACARELHPLGPVASEVLRSADLPPAAQEEKLQIALSEQRLALERHLGVLGTMG